ncbi:MAG: lipid-binding SYLF domain-containing protein [Thermoanaerobaculia bacterium]|nr:lipid-binding SYLF domain-containing protein [Thermoanaerobaculia bacterium]
MHTLLPAGRSEPGRLAAAALAVVLALAAAPASAAEPARKVRTASRIFEELLLGSERVVPEPLLRQTRCLAVFPGVTEAALGLGASHGRGVAACRGEGGEWSPPAFLTISGGSLGLQIGFRRVDLLLFFVSPKGARSLAEPKISLGGSVSIAAGPVDRTAAVSADPLYDRDVYLYSRARGLFAGASLEGSRIGAARRANEAYYGERLWPEQILFDGRVAAPPPEARALMDRLRELPPLAGPGPADG